MDYDTLNLLREGHIETINNLYKELEILNEERINIIEGIRDGYYNREDLNDVDDRIAEVQKTLDFEEDYDIM